MDRPRMAATIASTRPRAIARNHAAPTEPRATTLTGMSRMSVADQRVRRLGVEADRQRLGRDLGAVAVDANAGRVLGGVGDDECAVGARGNVSDDLRVG